MTTPTDTTPQTWVPADMDDATKGHIQARGWDKKPINEVAIEAVKAHREATALIGVPQERILKLPAANAAPEEWNPVWQRLGAAKTPDEIKTALTGVKFKDGAALDDTTTKALLDLGTKNHWSVATATEVAKTLVTATEAGDTTDAKAHADLVALGDKKLRENWGANYEPFKIVALRAAERLGPEYKEAALSLEKAAGYDKAMELFRMLGVQFGEDTFIRNVNGGANVALTKEQATARLVELRADKEWVAKHLKGDPATRKEHDALIAIQSGGA